MARDNTIQTTGGGAEPINVNYTVQTENRPSSAGASKLALTATRPAMIGAGVLALGTVALGIFDIFRVPGLQQQIEDLEEQVDLLEVQVVRLSVENDRFEQLNEELMEQVDVLGELNDELNETATELEFQVNALNNTVTNLSETSTMLIATGEEFEKLNSELNQTQQDLRVEIEELQILESNLTELNSVLLNNTEELANEVDELQNVTSGLQESVNDLEDQVQIISESNAFLAQAVDDLNTVTEYVNAAFGGFNDDLATVVAALNSSTVSTREGVFRSLLAYYRDVVTFWDCRNDDLFGNFPFFQDQSSPILDSGLGPFGDLVSTLDERMLSIMCLDRIDFQAYLTAEEGPLDTTSYDDFLRAAGNYGQLAIEHYGLPVGMCPEGSTDCVTASEWEEGGFECENVAQYRWQTAI